MVYTYYMINRAICLAGTIVFNLLRRMDSLDAKNTHFILIIKYHMTLISIYKVMIRSKVSQKYLQ